MSFIKIVPIVATATKSAAIPSVGNLLRMFSSSNSSRYDLVIYGATGFTGQFVVEEVARVAENEHKSGGTKLKWAVAGRNESKLLKAVDQAKQETGLSLDDVGVLKADVADLSSLDAMTKQAKVIINCVGPYIKFGEPVVQSCINNGTDHVDISGEPQFLEGMQLKHDKQAQEKGVHIVGACGYDSVPADVGLGHLASHFPGGLCSVEMYTSVSGKPAPVNTGTLESAITAVANRNQAAAQKRRLFPTKLPKPHFKTPSRSLVHYREEVAKYAIRFPSDEPVVYRTQRHRHDERQLEAVQFHQYLAVPTWWEALGISIGLLYFLIMGLFSCTRNLVLKYPEVLTAGVFSSKGATREQLRPMKMKTVLIGKGWSTPLANDQDRHTSPPDTTKTLTIGGSDPGYGATSLMLVASAMTLLREKDALSRCGVVTPGVAFENTSIVKRLTDRGMTLLVADN